jgi:hypothetical protein
MENADKSGERHRGKLAYTRAVTGQYEFAEFRILSEQNFHDVEFWGAWTGEADSTLILAVARSSRLLKSCGRKETGWRQMCVTFL